MKIIVTSLFFISCIFLMGFTNAHKNVSLSIPIQLILNEEEEEFVELMDGKIIKGDVTKCNVFKTSTFKKVGSGSVVIDGVKYESADVMAVHFNERHYRKNSYGEFAIRTQKGKINVYNTWGQTGSTMNSYYYLQKGDKGSLLERTKENLRMLISDCPPALAVLDNYYKLSKRAQSDKSVSVYYECIDTYDKY